MDYKRKLGHIFHTLGTTGLAYMVNYGTILVLTPYITETVGTEAYGFVSLAKQFAQYAVIVTTALNTYAARYIGIAYHKEEREKAKTYFSSVFWGDLFLASGIMAAALGPIFFLERLIHIPSEIVGDVKILFLLIFLNFWVSTVFSVFGCAGYIKDKVAMTGMFKTLSYLVNGAILILAYALFPAKIFYIGIGAMGASLVVACSDMWMTRRFTPDFHTKRSDRSLAAVKELVVAGCWASFNSVGEMLNHGLDLILCNQMISSLAMGQLAVAKTMYMVVQGLHMIIDQAFIPGFLKSYAEHDRQKLLEELKLSMKVSGLLANLIFAGFVSLGLAYYRRGASPLLCLYIDRQKNGSVLGHHCRRDDQCGRDVCSDSVCQNGSVCSCVDDRSRDDSHSSHHQSPLYLPYFGGAIYHLLSGYHPECVCLSGPFRSF